jgi:hypothetical protein
MHDSTKPTKKQLAAAPKTKEESLSSATHLTQRGFRVLPLKMPVPGDARGGKAPACRNGVRDATGDPKKFRKLVKPLPEFNIGIATGKPSNVVVIDIDPRNGGNETFSALEHEFGRLPETVTVKTGGGGTHLYFKAPKKQLPSCKLGDGVDFLANEKYVVAPPLVHALADTIIGRKIFHRTVCGSSFYREPCAISLPIGHAKGVRQELA